MAALLRLREFVLTRLGFFDVIPLKYLTPDEPHGSTCYVRILRPGREIALVCTCRHH